MKITTPQPPPLSLLTHLKIGAHVCLSKKSKAACWVLKVLKQQWSGLKDGVRGLFAGRPSCAT